MADMAQQNLFESGGQATGPVECLGLTFEDDDARREHFLAILREKLKDPEFRKIEGFPIGEDEDILALSDPPYYTACPNPFLGDFIRCYGKPYDPETDDYQREPFAADVSEGKNDPIYNAHSYHTKVPHKAIMRYILHYTKPGDIVLDVFSGTGMTGVAAQLTNRHSLLCDLSPAATFLASNFCAKYDSKRFENECEEVLKKVKHEVKSLYKYSDEKIQGFRSYTIYSTLIQCENCQQVFDQWSSSFDKESKNVLPSLKCPYCNFIFTTSPNHLLTQVFDPLLNQVITTKKRTQRFARISTQASSQEIWMESDGNSYDEYLEGLSAETIPIIGIPVMYESHFKRNLNAEGISYFHHFYTPRNLLACLRLHRIAVDSGKLFLFAFLNTSWHGTVQRRYNSGGGHRPKTNTLSRISHQRVLREVSSSDQS